jgi:hypothetical protein
MHGSVPDLRSRCAAAETSSETARAARWQRSPQLPFRSLTAPFPLASVRVGGARWWTWLVEHGRGDLVVGAPSTGKPTSIPVGQALEQRLAVEAGELDQRRELYRQVNGGKKAAEVTLDDVSFTTTTPTLVELTAVEDTKLFFAQTYPGVVDHEQYWLTHTFVFERDRAGWQLTSTTPHLACGSIPPATQFAESAPACAQDSQGTSPPLDGLVPSDTTKPQHIAASQAKPTATPQMGIASGYNYPAMVAYAVKWAKGRNPAYRSYGNDCTNFISQIMREGGWADVGSGFFDRTDNTKWFYGSQTYTTSYSWAGAPNWAEFAALASKRTSILPSIWNMGLADVLQVNWDHPAGGPETIDHSMVVDETAHDAYGYVTEEYMTYHTNDTYHRPLSEILATPQGSDPRNKWYAHRT